MSSLTLGFPQQLTEKYRPTNLDQFVGLEKPKRIFSKFAANPFPSAWLLKGSSGTGKTTFSLAVASMIGAELHHVPSQECSVDNLERVRRICQYVPSAGNAWHLILIDEADQMSNAAQIKLLSYLDSTNFPPNTIFIMTCNSTDRLEDRFLSRLHTVEFSSYGIAKDAAALLESVWIAERGPDGERPNFARIVKESNNNVRECLTNLELEIMMS